MLAKILYFITFAKLFYTLFPMAKKQAYTIKQGEELAKDYCSVQERCHQEVYSKLINWGLNSEQSDEVLTNLISQNYINEERFAQMFARSKFNQNKWGRVKIKYSLKQKGISERCISKGLQEIDDNDYNTLCIELAKKKLQTLSAESKLTKRKKIISYLNSKGFEYEVINNILETIFTE